VARDKAMEVLLRAGHGRCTRRHHSR
jgi:hypothetical protein